MTTTTRTFRVSVERPDGTCHTTLVDGHDEADVRRTPLWALRARGGHIVSVTPAPASPASPAASSS